MHNTPTPRTVKATKTMRRIHDGDLREAQKHEQVRARRQRAASNGYRGPLTRAEYAARNTSSR
jgi:hypothetical protein